MSFENECAEAEAQAAARNYADDPAGARKWANQTMDSLVKRYAELHHVDYAIAFDRVKQRTDIVKLKRLYAGVMR